MNARPGLDLKFGDFLTALDKLGTTEWITLYASRSEGLEWFQYYCALVRNDWVTETLSRYSWDTHIDGNRPGFSFSFQDGKQIATYTRGFESGIEPLIIWRDFYGMKEGYWEVSEEFRLYFKLYDDKKRKRLVQIDDSGNDEDVVSLDSHEVKIKLRLVKEYLSVRQMHLALYFSLDRFSEKSTRELGIEEFQEEKKGKHFVYSIGARDFTFGDERNVRSQGYLVGKKLITGLQDFKPSLFGGGERKFRLHNRRRRRRKRSPLYL